MSRQARGRFVSLRRVSARLLKQAVVVLGLWAASFPLWAQPEGDGLPEPTPEESFHAAVAMLFSMIFGLVTTFVGLRLLSWRRQKRLMVDKQQPKKADNPFARAEQYFRERDGEQ